MSTTQIILARNDTSISTARDLLNSGQTLGAVCYRYEYAGNDRQPIVPGYDRGEIQGRIGLSRRFRNRLGGARGEASLTCASYSFYLARRDAIRNEGIMTAFMQIGDLTPIGTFRRNRQFPELSTMVEAVTELNHSALQGLDFAAFRSVVGAAALQFSFVLPSATTPAIVDVMRNAVRQGLNDPEARAAVQASL